MNRRGLSSLIVFVLFTFLTCIDDKSALACPSEVCVCKWKGGKQSVECGGQMLASLPEGMDPGTQVLNFSGNSLQVMKSESFLRMDLVNLQKIYLSRNQLIRIHDKAFRGLSNLVELDLSDNSLQQVPTETFQDYTSLMRLSLSGNPIRNIKSSAFRHLAYLTTLELSNCQIEKIENEAFIGMDNLEWLRLDGNRISYIQGNHILPKSLHGISLHSNRWTCDCRLIDIHAWLINYNTPQTDEPQCVEPPRLKGQAIKSLKKDELACMPDVTPKSTYTEISEGRNISIMCVVRAIPEPKVLWLFNGMVLTNDSFIDNLHMFYYVDESGVEEKRSEVYIYNVGPEDNGTFSCVGQNVAGTTFSNYTLRVIIKEPPVVKEVSFAKDYMNYILASSGGGCIIFAILLCTIAIKCRQKRPRAKSSKMLEQSSNDSGLLKCSSIITEEEMSPKSSKENGILIGGHHMKQNYMMYAPTLQPGHLMDNGNMQLNSTPPLDDTDGHSGPGVMYCSPPATMRNYQDQNPDLINDAESGKNKQKPDAEYDAGSDCSVPCSIQGNFENCYQLSNQFGSQIMRPSSNQRFTALSTIPRGLQLKATAVSQHQVDVHLNPVCFLSQDGYAYDFSNNHLHNPQQQQQPQPLPQSNQQQNFYRTLPHNRAHKQSLFAASAANPAARYSLEAEFLQRTGTPTYDKFLPNVRFTAEGYPVHPVVQYPSPPEGYKGDFTIAAPTTNFQQWPPCLPGYHTQPIRYPISVVPAPPAMQSMQSLPPPPSAASSDAVQSQPVTSNQTHTQTSSSGSAASTGTEVVKKRCVGAQTSSSDMDPATIPECDEEQEGNLKLRHLAGPLADSPDEGYVGDSQEGSDI